MLVDTGTSGGVHTLPVCAVSLVWLLVMASDLRGLGVVA